jgi:hypothetical protein
MSASKTVQRDCEAGYAQVKSEALLKVEQFPTGGTVTRHERLGERLSKSVRRSAAGAHRASSSASLVCLVWHEGSQEIPGR